MINLPHELIVMMTAMLPVVELRGAIPLAVAAYNMNGATALLWSVVGNSIAAIGVFVVFGWMLEWTAHRWYRLNRLLAWVGETVHQRHSNRVERWETIALFLLVAIPLPFTGVWTGAILASVVGFSFRRAAPPLLLGVATAGIVVTLVTTGAVRIGTII